MMYRMILCPHCGNDTTAKGIQDTQKCRWCRRLYRIDMKHLKGKKWSWTPIPVDFPADQQQKNRQRKLDRLERPEPNLKTLDQYRKEDYYGV